MSSVPLDKLFAGTAAEHEQAWLAQALVVPQAVRNIHEMASIVILGSSGSGKTALRLAHLMPPDPKTLAVLWLPRGLPNHQSHTSTTLLADLCSVFAETLVSTLGRTPTLYHASPAWVQETIASFVATVMVNQPLHRVAGRISQGYTELGRQLVEQLLLPSNRPEPIQQPLQVLFEECIGCLKGLGFNQSRIIVDQIERIDQHPGTGQNTVEILLSLLPLYEIPEMSFWFLLPESYQMIVSASHSVQRRRLRLIQLAWREEELVELLNKRLALWQSQPDFTINQIVPLTLLLPFLQQQPALPRTWIEFFYPVLIAYLSQNTARPLNSNTLRRVLPVVKPILQIEADRVFVNRHEINGLSPQARDLLRFLNQHRGLICTRAQIYFQGIRGMEKVPNENEAGYIEPDAYRQLVDTAVNRLRDKIEPDRDKPIFIETVRNRGIRLRE